MTTETITHALTPRRVLWLALVTVLAASWSHVAGTFGTLEHGGAPAVLTRLAPLMGPLAAVAIDLGLIATAWGIGARKRDKPGETPWGLWVGVGVFAGLSALANFDHALTVLGNGTTGAAAWAALDWYTRVKVVLLSATLPLLAAYLTRVVETAVDAGRDTEGDAGQDAPTLVDWTGSDTPPPGALVMEWDNGERVVVPAASYTNGHIATVPVPPSPPKPRRTTGRARLTPEMYRAIAAEHVPDGAKAQEADRIVARLAKVSEKTAQRARLAGQET